MRTASDVETKANAHQHALLLGACCSALATLVPVALYQTGVLSRLPDPPMSVFDSERITMSKAAHPLGIPDALLGLASFGATLTLAILARRHRTARPLLAAKIVLDASAAAFNAGRQVFSFGKLCSWCTGTAISVGVMAYAGRTTIHDTFSESVAIGRKTASGTYQIVEVPPIQTRVDSATIHWK
ncbi:vitamin K epoxide reductase family protein [Alloacidobacterium dinghuense]|uniref:Vitamin K epoxide reductase family protein n=1 Tax=Alloacidobacterium dinghuense TaxID=2763107 RepID=A0A7G8BHC3_9BACT|nr:vitamin K epoxide reductase family protein [Alloacidobacterium dinghuense]QNI31943.1 vitamin K epoxide reductase family protein [Alloacidobacterium dinghuense]